MWVCTRVAQGLEVGPRAGHSHLQIFCTFLVCIPFKDALKNIIKAVKEFVPIMHGDKGKVHAKVLQGQQSVLGMIGYVCKAPLRVRFWNVDAATVREAQEYYALVSVNPLSGKRPLNKSNFFKELFSFWHRELRPVFVQAREVTLHLVQSGLCMPFAVWTMGG